MQFDLIPEYSMLKTRIITAIILLAVLLPILFLLPGIYLSAFFLLTVLLAAWEWSRLIAPGSRRGEIIYPIFCLLIILGLLTLNNPVWQFALLAIAVMFWFFIAPFMLAKGLNVSLDKWRYFYSLLGLVACF